MNEATIGKICAELSDRLSGQKFGKVFAISRFQLAIDFRISDGRYLFLSVEPNSPRIYFIKRKLKELEKQSQLQLSFVSFLRKRLANSTLVNVEKISDERIVKFMLFGESALGKSEHFTLVAQLTGRSSNLFLLGQDSIILDSLRETRGNGQRKGDRYQFPERSKQQKRSQAEVFSASNFENLSEALDDFYLKQDEERRFRKVAAAARTKLNSKQKKNKRLQRRLIQDLENHGDAEKWKKMGNLILANTANAKRSKNKVTLVDYFEDSAPEIEIEVDENLSLSEAAEKFFKRYTKARNAKTEISKRLSHLELAIEKIEKEREKLDVAISQNDLEFLNRYQGEKNPKNAKKRLADSFTGAKRFVSSDGLDILVGKRSKDNDFLTFRVAKSLDLWLHAADYPGSHVIVKNPTRKEISKQTLLEAAQLAAFYSKAKTEGKAAVHYTQKKFVNKPKGGQPGLVSLASFKTIIVKPKFLVKKKDG